MEGIGTLLAVRQDPRTVYFYEHLTCEMRLRLFGYEQSRRCMRNAALVDVAHALRLLTLAPRQCGDWQTQYWSKACVFMSS